MSGRTVAVTSQGFRAAVLQADPGPFRIAPLFERADLRPLGFAPWDAGRVLVAAVAWAPEPIEAWVTRYDPGNARVLPGGLRLGEGLPGRAAADAAGRVWLLLPGSAELVRLSPTR